MAETLTKTYPSHPKGERYHGDFELLDTLEGKEKLADAILKTGSIKAACLSLNIPHPTVFCRLHVDPELMTIVRAARTTVLERDIEKHREIEDELYDTKPDRDRISALREVMKGIQWRAQRCNPAVYGDKPGTQINVSTQIGVVCDEATRKELIELRQKIQASQLPPIEADYATLPSSSRTPTAPTPDDHNGQH